jgi:replicative DNA helicase
MNSRELYSPDAEHGVLGALMHKPDLCEEIGAFLSAAHFGHDDTAMLYNLILATHAKGIKPDSITLSDVCEVLPSGDLTIVAASTIMRDVPSVANASSYARTVLERATARRLYDIGMSIASMAQTRGPIASQIAEAQQALFDINVQEDIPDVMHYRDMLAGVIDEMDMRLNGQLEIGLEFGLADLDDIIKGLRPGNLVIVAGKPGTGKTVLGTNLADRISSKEGKSSLIFSLEMPGAELVKRALAAAGGVDKGWIDTGGKDSDQYWPALTAAVETLRNSDVRICDKGSLTFSRICNIARFQHRAKPLHLIVVDYLTLIRADKEDRFGTRSQEIGSFTRGFKALAKELNIPIVVLAQLNRASESRSAAEAKPRMSDLRDSGEIEQDADIIILGHRADDEKGRNGITSWEVPKVRHASPGSCVLQFQGAYQRFVSAAPQEMVDYQEQKQNSGSSWKSRKFAPGFD